MKTDDKYEIQPKVYLQLYDALYNNLLINELKGILPSKARGTHTNLVWQAANAGELFKGTNSGDDLLFYRERSKAKEGKSIFINILTLSKALNYLGYKSATSTNNLKEISESQFQAFCDDLEIFIEDSITSINQKQTDISIKVAKTVENFYHFMSIGKYEECWKLLSHKFRCREPWLDNFEKFEIGFTNTREIRNIHVFNQVQHSNSFVECLVFYEDGIQKRIIEQIESLNVFSIKHVNKLTQIIDELGIIIKDKGGANFSNIQIERLFDPNASEHIWHKSELSKEDFNELFPISKHIWVKRLYSVSCKFIDGKWVIDGILPEKTYGSR